MSDTQTDAIVQALTHAFLGGPWLTSAMARRGAEAIGVEAPWLLPLARRCRARFGAESAPTDRWELLHASIASDRGFTAGLEASRRVARQFDRPRPRPARFYAFEPTFADTPFPVPRLTTKSGLARWLGVSEPDLLWLADPMRLLRRATDPRLHHYHSTWIPKRDGGQRLLERPKSLLKSLQQKILHGILDHAPPHPAAHGFRKGHSILTFTAPHAGQAVVIRVDLADFFGSVGFGRVRAIFRALGYPDGVARLLAGLATTETPQEVLRARDQPTSPADARRHATAAQRLRGRHLPQGAPTSPALANLAAWRLDVRLTALAQGLDATYGRYADDLALSGGPVVSAGSERLRSLIYQAIFEEGFAPNPRKSRVMRSGRAQRLTGLVVNVQPTLARADYDRLRAILHNCSVHGPEHENREARPDFRAHLEGRVAFVASTHPDRGRRLREALSRIQWRT